MMWLWIALAFVGGAVGGIAFGHKARGVAHFEGYKLGIKHGWQDAKDLEEKGKFTDDVDL
jgi:hypothetical protein